MGRFIPNENTFVAFTTEAPGALDGPTITTVTANASGGTLPAAAHSYAVSVLTASGESEIGSVHTGSANTLDDSNTITWPAVEGETLGYNVYGRVAGSLGLIGHVASGILTFTDTGAVSPGKVPPVTNSSSNLASPHVADIDNAIELTHYLMSLNFSAAGNVVPTPALDTLFESSIIGTSQATATADFYRDDEVDLAWDTLVRGTKGYMYVSRFGGKPNVAGDAVEVWPTNVVSRAMANMANNTVETFTATFSVPIEPNEDAVVVA